MRATRASPFAFVKARASRSDGIGLRLTVAARRRNGALQERPHCYILNMRKLLLTAALPTLLLALVACSDDDPPPATPTPPVQVTMAPSPNAVTSTPSGPSATAAATVPPVDGTVFPQNPGSTDPTTIKSN